MKTIKVGFSRPKSWFVPFSWLIRLFLWTPYSHVYVKYHSDSLDRDIIYQASGLKVNFVGNTLFQTEELVVKEFSLNIPDDFYNKMLQESVDEAGVPYSMMQIFNTLGYLLFKTEFFKNKIAGYDCSRLVAQILEIDPQYNLPPLSIVTPKDVYNYLEKKEQNG